MAPNAGSEDSEACRGSLIPRYAKAAVELLSAGKSDNDIARILKCEHVPNRARQVVGRDKRPTTLTSRGNS